MKKQRRARAGLWQVCRQADGMLASPPTTHARAVKIARHLTRVSRQPYCPRLA